MTYNSVEFWDLLGSELTLFSLNSEKSFHCQKKGSTLPFAGYDKQPCQSCAGGYTVLGVLLQSETWLGKLHSFHS